jgi:phosphoserine phosphatase
MYVLSCVSSQGFSEDFLKEVKELFSIKGLSITDLHQRDYALDIRSTSGNPLIPSTLKLDLMQISNKYTVDLAFLYDDSLRSDKRLVVFDMDSTLIRAEVIDEMAASLGIGNKVKEITERTMNGELDFDRSLRERVMLLKGMPRKNLEEIMGRLPLMPGVEKFIKTIKGMGLKTAIVSGGFRYFAENLRAQLGIDYAFANELEWDGDLLSGKVAGRIINAQVKANILEELARKEGLRLEQVIAIGDGANDLLMLAKAGMGIAFHAKEKVRREASLNVGHGPMTTILYYLGIPGNHFDEAL